MTNRLPPYSDDEFVNAWRQSRDLEDVAERLGIPLPVVIAKAAHYRNLGVPLEKLRRRKGDIPPFTFQ